MDSFTNVVSREIIKTTWCSMYYPLFTIDIIYMLSTVALAKIKRVIDKLQFILGYSDGSWHMSLFLDPFLRQRKFKCTVSFFYFTKEVARHLLWK